jgi:hypothetical protein
MKMNESRESVLSDFKERFIWKKDEKITTAREIIIKVPVMLPRGGINIPAAHDRSRKRLKKRLIRCIFQILGKSNS